MTKPDFEKMAEMIWAQVHIKQIDTVALIKGQLEAAYEQGAVDILERRLEEKNTEEAWMEARATVVAILNENKPQFNSPKIKAAIGDIFSEWKSRGKEAFFDDIRDKESKPQRLGDEDLLKEADTYTSRNDDAHLGFIEGFRACEDRLLGKEDE